MNLLTLILLAFAMSTDAFAAAIGKGARLKNPQLKSALKIGLVFGLIEAIFPVIGWYIGKSAFTYVQAWDHWIALFLLVALGSHMIYEGVTPHKEEIESIQKLPIFMVVLTAIGTSIDALAVGVSLAFVSVNIWTAATLIGLATFMMVTIGVMLGRVLGSVLGNKAEIAGGLTVICVGVWIFLSHL